MKKIVVITGIDGSGKTTIIDNLRNIYHNAQFADIWDLFKEHGNLTLFKSKSNIDDYLCQLTPNSRLFFLVHALQFSLDKALKGNKEFIIFDSYYLKYFMSELALGANIRFITNLIDTFIKPNLILQLSTDIEVCADRKKSFSRYECGISDSPNRNSFVQFQQKVLQKWAIFSSEKIIQIDGNEELEKKVDMCKNLIDSYVLGVGNRS